MVDGRTIYVKLLDKLLVRKGARVELRITRGTICGKGPQQRVVASLSIRTYVLNGHVVVVDPTDFRAPGHVLGLRRLALMLNATKVMGVFKVEDTGEDTEEESMADGMFRPFHWKGFQHSCGRGGAKRLTLDRARCKMHRAPFVSESRRKKRCKRSATTFDALPDDVADRIFCKLPALDLVEQVPQQVCTQWRSKLRSPLFQRLYDHSSNATRSKWLLAEPGQGKLLYIFDTNANRYSKASKAQLLASAGVPSPADWDLCAGASGLLLFGPKRDSTPKRREFVLVNPVNRTKLMVPPLPFGVGVRFLKEHGVFPPLTVLLLESHQLLLLESLPRRRMVALVYDFRTRVWTVKQSCSGRINCWAKVEFDAQNLIAYVINPESMRLFSYNIRTDQWTSVALDPPPTLDLFKHSVIIPAIVVCQGQPLLLSLLQDPMSVNSKKHSPETRDSQLSVWRINKEQLQLESVAPSALMRKLYTKAKYPVTRHDPDFNFKFCSDGVHSIWLMLTESGHMLHYDRPSKLWTLLPGFPGRIMGGELVCTTFSFQDHHNVMGNL